MSLNVCTVYFGIGKLTAYIEVEAGPGAAVTKIQIVVLGVIENTLGKGNLSKLL